MDPLIHHADTEKLMPFDVGDTRELRLRSAIHFAESQSCPVTFYVGEDDRLAKTQLDDYISRATRAGRQCEKVEVGGTHLTSKYEAIQKSAQWFLNQCSR
jgi:hypothetical protein